MTVGVIGKGILSLTLKLALAERNIDTLSCNFGGRTSLYLFINRLPSDLKQIKNNNLKNNTVKDIVNKSDVIYIAVDTETNSSDSLDTSDLFSLAEQIGNRIESYKLIVIKSLVPVGTCNKVKSIINTGILSRNSPATFDIIYNPEFYDEEDSYVDIFVDSIWPSDILIGIDNQKSFTNFFNILSRLYDIDTLLNLNVMSIEAAETSAFHRVGMH